ncbi:MAG: hypothetical protein VYE04_07940 [Pseudomonadota bacterium]|nr:hypothetical protein [Pseudomonadota bacterium]
MRASRFQASSENNAFTDLLFNALLGFTFLFFCAFVLITDPEAKGKVNPNAEVLISVSWPDNHPDDVDAVVEDPRGNLVWYHNNDTGLMHLDRDDRGTFQDTVVINGKTIVSPINQETVSLRALGPGEYVVNLLHYKAHYEDPLQVTVKIEKLNPTVTLEYYGHHKLHGVGDEVTAVRFTVNSDGSLGDFSSRPKGLIVNAVKGINAL